MVDQADTILAVYNQKEGSKSSTAQTVRMANKMQKRIIVIDPITAKAATNFVLL